MMKTLFFTMLLMASIIAGHGGGDSEVAKGLTVFDDSSSEGRFVFLMGSPGTGTTNSAGIYVLNLTNRTLELLVRSPWGILVAGEKSFAVAFEDSAWRKQSFLFSERFKASSFIEFSDEITETVILNDRHVYYATRKKWPVGGHLIHYDMKTRETNSVSIPGCAENQANIYRRLHQAAGEINVLHFDYSHDGREADCRSGLYALNSEDGGLRYVGGGVDPDWDQEYQTDGGDYVYFEGGSGPITGRRLMISRQRFLGGKTDKEARLLHEFPRPGLNGVYNLLGLSPSRKLAFVAYIQYPIQLDSEPVRETRTYYVVDIASGATAKVLKDSVSRKVRSLRTSIIEWVP